MKAESNQLNALKWKLVAGDRVIASKLKPNILKYLTLNGYAKNVNGRILPTPRLIREVKEAILNQVYLYNYWGGGAWAIIPGECTDYWVKTNITYLKSMLQSAAKILNKEVDFCYYDRAAYKNQYRHKAVHAVIFKCKSNVVKREIP